jgi:RNA polymerase sigma-70 factor (ECF subfamily)
MMRLYIRQSLRSAMGTMEGQFVGWLEAEAVALPEQDTHARVTALVEEYSTTPYSVTRNAADAEDVVQETFLRVLRHRNKLAEVRDYRVWLVRIAWNLVLDRKRRAKTRPQVDDFEELARVLPTGEMSAEKMVITAQRHARILGLIDNLPAREREVLLLSAVKELSTVEIALVLDTTESTIRSRLYRARHALAAMLEQEGSLQ